MIVWHEPVTTQHYDRDDLHTRTFLLSGKQQPIFWTSDKVWLFVTVVAFINVTLWFGHVRIGNEWNFIAKCGFVFAACSVFDDLVADRWLDRARLMILDSRYQQRHHYDSQPNVCTYSKLWSAHEQRKAHFDTEEDTSASSRPWTGPNNWHYETCDCIRGVILSLVMTAIYLWADIRMFQDWWIPLVWGKYMQDIVMYVLHQPAVGVSWLNLLFSHHLGAGVFLAGASIWSTQTIPSVYLCIAMIWLSNICSTGLFVYRSFFGMDYHAAWLLAFVIQRLLRWGGTVSAVYGIVRSDDYFVVIMFQAPTFHIWNIICLLAIEVIDVSAQKKTLRRFWQNRKA